MDLKIHGDDPVPSKVPGGSIVEILSEQLVKVNTGKYGSTLWDITNTTYNSDGLPRVLNLTSDPYEAGFDTGLMLARVRIQDLHRLGQVALWRRMVGTISIPSI